MKIIIQESQISNALQTFVNSIKYDEVCEFLVDTEFDKYTDIWVHAIISEDWYLYADSPQSMNKVAWVNKIRRETRDSIKNFMGIDVRVGSYVRKCK
jgi:ABC-type microcin C transport system permease subunit YejE